MSIAWVVPTTDDVAKYIADPAIAAANPEDAGGEKRLVQVLANTVARVRGAIAAAARVPLSLTADSVPPEGKQHTLVLAAYALMASTPRLAEFAVTDGFQKLIDKAEEWLEKVQEGLPVSEPTDPDTAATPGAPTWGDYRGEQVAGVAGKFDVETE